VLVGSGCVSDIRRCLLFPEFILSRLRTFARKVIHFYAFGVVCERLSR
jgi:hypothetical protein